MKPILKSQLLTALLSFLIAVQSMLPGALAVFQGEDFDASVYLCNVPDQELSPQTREAMAVLLAALGEDAPNSDEKMPSEHCPDCIIFELALPTPSQTVDPVTWSFAAKTQFFKTPDFIFRAQGPPLGGRAPPSFSLI